jgi:hypothetical protein
MSELFVSSPEDLGQVILVEQRGEQRPFVASDALERLVTEDPRMLPTVLRGYRAVLDPWDDGTPGLRLHKSNRRRPT